MILLNKRSVGTTLYLCEIIRDNNALKKAKVKKAFSYDYIKINEKTLKSLLKNS